MGKIADDETRRLKNDNFIKAFDYIASVKELNQKALAEIIGSKSSYISIYRKYVKPVPKETADALVRYSITIGHQIYSEFLAGNSDIMLMDNVTDEDMMEAEARKDPDYAALKRREQQIQQQVLGHIVAQPSSEGYAADDPRPNLPTWADTLLEILSKQIAENEALHTQLRQSIDEINEIKTQLAKILSK